MPNEFKNMLARQLRSSVVPSFSDKYKAVLVYEFLGSAIVTYAFTLCLGDQLVRALAFFAVYLLAAPISGGHFNPATSLACYLTERPQGGVKPLLLLMFVQLVGSYLGILLTFLLARDFVPYRLFPAAGNTLYSYRDTFTGTEGFHFARLFGQEALQTFIFTLVFLQLRSQAYFKRSNPVVKGLVLAYVLAACYRFSYGAGACLNPAIGVSQSTYMIGLENAKQINNYYDSCFWVYILAPFVGAVVAALASRAHQASLDQAEEALQQHHLYKLSHGRSMDGLDVEDTRSRQSECRSE